MALKSLLSIQNTRSFFRHYFSIWNPLVAGKVKKILNEIKPDIVHAHNIHTHISYHSLKLAKKMEPKFFNGS